MDQNWRFANWILLSFSWTSLKPASWSSGLSLDRVPWVPGTRKILSSYVMAPVNFYKISREQLPGTPQILRPIICGTRGLKFLTTALIMSCNKGTKIGRTQKQCSVSSHVILLWRKYITTFRPKRDFVVSLITRSLVVRLKREVFESHIMQLKCWC